jgi:hypothetical protein
VLLDKDESYLSVDDIEDVGALEDDLVDFETGLIFDLDVVAERLITFIRRFSVSVSCSNLANSGTLIGPGAKRSGTLPLKDKSLGSNTSHAEALRRSAVTVMSPGASRLRLIV